MNGASLPVQPWLLVLAHSFLVVAVLSIYLFCTVIRDGSTAVIWIEPSLLGFSLYAILSAVNLLLLVLLIGTALLLPGASSGRMDKTRTVTLVGATLLLVGTQAVVSGWRSMAENDLESSVEWRRTTELRVSAIETEIAGLKDHPWAGEYFMEIREPESEVRYWLAPDSGWASIWTRPDYLHPEQRTTISNFSNGDLELLGGVVRMSWVGPNSGALFVPVVWGERHYLVDVNHLDGFKAKAHGFEVGVNGEFRMDHGMLLLRADQVSRIHGEPQFPPGY